MKHVAWIGVAVAVAVAVAWYVWPNEERRVRGRLTELAAAASVPAGESDLSRLARLPGLARAMSDDVSLSAPGLPSVEGRDAVIALAARIASVADPFEVAITGMDVTIDGIYAHASLTVGVTGSDESATRRRFDGQEWSVDLIQSGGTWLVRHVEPIETLEHR